MNIKGHVCMGHKGDKEMIERLCRRSNLKDISNYEVVVGEKFSQTTLNGGV